MCPDQSAQPSKFLFADKVALPKQLVYGVEHNGMVMQKGQHLLLSHYLFDLPCKADLVKQGLLLWAQ